MSTLCILCRQAPGTRMGHRYCRACHEEFIAGGGRLDLPDGHPFTVERARRVERMRQRAERGLPIFEDDSADLS